MVQRLVTGVTALVAVAALFLVGAAGRGPGSDPSSTLQRMLVAIGNGNFDGACDLMARGRQPLSDTDRVACASALRVYAEGAPPRAVSALRSADVPDIAASGTRVKVAGAGISGVEEPFRQRSFTLVVVRGKWYVEAQ